MTHTTSEPESEHPPAELCRRLADGRARYLLTLVRERSPAEVSTDDLATHFAAFEAGCSLIEVDDADHERARADLHHRHLPALEDAGAIRRSKSDGVVAVDHPVFEDDEFLSLVTDRDRVDDDSLDELLRAIADSRRRVVLSILGEQLGPISTRTLARDVAAREAGTDERSVSPETVDSVFVSLVHSHLPFLAEAGLVEYDTDDDHVAYDGHPDLRVRWLGPGGQSGDGDRTGASASGNDDIRTLEGRDPIVRTGQSLCERAEDELFLLFTTTGLLEEGCLARIEDAIDRGVDVYLGTRDPEVRTVVRERAPEVVLWEPQLDWLNLPPESESVGRLVFADREAVMLGTLGTSDDADAYAETAIVGEGPGNGLVVLMRTMLGSRLDHLDAQSEDFLSQLPL